MTNRYYNPTGAPITLSRGASPVIRNEYALVEAGFATAQGEMDLRAPLASAHLTGLPTAPTAPPGTSTAQLATTAFVAAQVEADLLEALISTHLTGLPTAPTAPPGTSTAQLATTAFVTEQVGTSSAALQVEVDLRAPLASPALTGVPTAPTATTGTSTAQLATTAFVMAQAFSAVLPGQTLADTGKFLMADGLSATWAFTLSINRTSYDNRSDLRSLADPDGSYKLVESIGLFRFYTGSVEPDDDETCFATATGKWLLECPHWDVIDAMQSADESMQDDRIEGAETRLDSTETRWPGRVLYGSAWGSLTSLAAVTQVGFPVTIAGAAVGDHVLVNPPNLLSKNISCYARASAADTITIYINNPSAATATLVAGTWDIAVIKEI